MEITNLLKRYQTSVETPAKTYKIDAVGDFPVCLGECSGDYQGSLEEISDMILNASEMLSPKKFLAVQSAKEMALIRTALINSGQKYDNCQLTRTLAVYFLEDDNLYVAFDDYVEQEAFGLKGHLALCDELPKKWWRSTVSEPYFLKPNSKIEEIISRARESKRIVNLDEVEGKRDTIKVEDGKSPELDIALFGYDVATLVNTTIGPTKHWLFNPKVLKEGFMLARHDEDVIISEVHFSTINRDVSYSKGMTAFASKNGLSDSGFARAVFDVIDYQSN